MDEVFTWVKHHLLDKAKHEMNRSLKGEKKRVQNDLQMQERIVVE